MLEGQREGIAKTKAAGNYEGRAYRDPQAPPWGSHGAPPHQCPQAPRNAASAGCQHSISLGRFRLSAPTGRLCMGSDPQGLTPTARRHL
jgi:hypothetical protein